MFRFLPALAATSALALGAFALPMSAHAAGPFDGTWIIDVPSDTIAQAGQDPVCPALRLRVQITDGQVSGQFRRVAPEESNVVETGGTNAAAQVTGNVRPDGVITAQWQNFHAEGQMAGDNARLMMQSECGPLKAQARRLEDMSTETVAMTTQAPAASSTTQTASAASGPSDGYNVYFDFDRSKLTTAGHAVVDAAVQATHDDQTRRIALVGKADRSGTDPYNMALSERRADKVRDAMVAGGVPASRIDVRWVGEREPPDPTANGVRDAQNRVVEVAIR